MNPSKKRSTTRLERTRTGALYVFYKPRNQNIEEKVMKITTELDPRTDVSNLLEGRPKHWMVEESKKMVERSDEEDEEAKEAIENVNFLNSLIRKKFGVHRRGKKEVEQVLEHISDGDEKEKPPQAYSASDASSTTSGTSGTSSNSTDTESSGKSQKTKKKNKKKSKKPKNSSASPVLTAQAFDYRGV